MGGTTANGAERDKDKIGYQLRRVLITQLTVRPMYQK
jgi:hypothetical protein